MCYSLIMSPKLSHKKLAVLGAGKLGGILLRAFLKQGLFASNRVAATVRHAERATALAKELGIAVTTNSGEAVKGADVILLTVKPQAVGEVLQQIAPEIGPEALLVSVAASVPTGFIEKQLAAASGGKHDNVAVIRAMPNTPVRRRLRHDDDLWRDSRELGSSRNRRHVRRCWSHDCRR